MENILKITTLEAEMKGVNKKLDDLDEQIAKGFESIQDELKCYVRKEEFAPIKSIVYGMAGAILTAFLGGLIFLVFK